MVVVVVGVSVSISVRVSKVLGSFVIRLDYTSASELFFCIEIAQLSIFN